MLGTRWLPILRHSFRSTLKAFFTSFFDRDYDFVLIVAPSVARSWKSWDVEGGGREYLL